MLKKILILSDGIPGHFNQSKGISSLFAQTLEIEEKIHEIGYRINLLRGLFNVIGRFILKFPHVISAKIILLFYAPLDIKSYDLIIASGGKTAPLSAALRLIYGIPVIQLGSPRGIHSSLFSALITVERYFDDPSNVTTLLTPNLYSPEACLFAAQQHGLSEHLLFLIGGEGIGYSYKLTEWEALISRIKSLYQQNQIPITIVTSRRTSPEIEKKFRRALSNIPLSYSAWFHKGDKDFNLSALFGSANNIFVTEDSSMMISEAISSGKPVTTLYPSKINTPLRYRAHIQKYLELGFIKRQSINNFSLNTVRNSPINIQNYFISLKKELLERVQW